MLHHVLIPALGILAGIISISAYPPYIRDMLKGTTKPERASWLIWSALALIALTSQLAAGAHWSIYMTLAQTVGVIVIFILSLKYGYGGLKKRDIISIIIAALGVAGWLITNSPLFALLCVVAVDAAGAWLTVYKAFKDPGSETLITWELDSLSNLLGLLAVGTFSFSLVLYPAYLLVANGAVVVAILIARQNIKSKKLNTIKS